MSEHLTDEEQLENLKRLWKEYGTTIIASIVIATGAYFSWNYWQDQMQAKAESASAAYEELVLVINQQATAETGELDALKATAEHLILQVKTIDSDSRYAVNATLFKAKQAVKDNDLPTATTELRWALEHSQDANVTEVIKLRLARVLSSSEKYDEALLLLVNPPAGFVAEQAEVRGDILRQKGDLSAALTSYEKALEHLGEAPEHRLVIQMKLDDLKTPAKAEVPAA